MVIVIHQAAHTKNALHYNEKKVKERKAVFFHSRNTLSANPFVYDEKHRLKNLLDIEKVNTRVKNKCLHISFNPSVDDYRKLGDQIIRSEIDRMMEHMGYANQPYFVCKHQDLERVKYDLLNKQTKVQPDFKFSPRSRNIKQNLENLFAHLNRRPEITSKEMYKEALQLFNVEIKKSGRGHIVLVTDGEGNPIRYPIRLSKFKERPGFYVSAKVEKTKEISKPVIDKFQLAQWARDLDRLVKSIRELDYNKKQKIRKSNPNHKRRKYGNRF